MNAIDAKGQSKKFAWDGKLVTLAISEKTKIRKDGVEVGDKAAAFSRDGTALIVLSGEKTSK